MEWLLWGFWRTEGLDTLVYWVFRGGREGFFVSAMSYGL